MKGDITEGLRVVEYGQMVTAPYCTKLLADMGSEVIKVEHPGLGDPARRNGPFLGDIPNLERSGLFLYLNTNKLGITLNLALEAGRDILTRLLKDVDVFVENIPADQRELIGLDYARIMAINPRLIILSVTPNGLSGPHRHYKGNYLTAFHGGGYGYDYPKPADDPEQEPPLRGGGRAADFITALTACIALMQAVIGRGANGRGAHIDLSQQEAIAYTQYGPLNQFNKGETFSRAKADFKPGFVTAVLPCEDGYVAVSPREEHQWARWIDVMGNPEWTKDDRFKDVPSRTAHWDEIVGLMSEWSRSQKKDNVYRAAQENRVVSYPFNTMADLVTNPQLAHRQYYTRLEHPELGVLSLPGLPFISTIMPKRPPRPSPRLGQHNEAIYCETLGYSREDLVRLRELGVV